MANESIDLRYESAISSAYNFYSSALLAHKSVLCSRILYNRPCDWVVILPCHSHILDI